MANDKITFNAAINLSTDSAQRQWDNFVNDAVSQGEAGMKKLNKSLGGREKTIVEVEFDPKTNKYVSQTRQILTATDKLVKLKDEAIKKDRESLTSLKGQLRQATQQRDAVRRLVVSTDKYGKIVKSVNPEWRKQNQQVQELNRKIADASGNWMKMITSRIPGGKNVMALANGLTQIGFAAAGVVQAFQAINAAFAPVIARTKQLQGLDLAFQGFGLTAEQSAQIMEVAKTQAFTYGASLTQLEKGYKRLTPAIMNGGGSMDDVAQAMASLSARTTTLGLNSEQTGRYSEAFAQVMGKGKLQGEELNQQFSELDGALRGQIASYAAAKYGITDFEKAMQKGEVTAKMFLEAFNAISEDMRENLAGSVTEVQSRIDELNVAQLQNISDTLNNITLESLGETFGKFGKQMMSVKLMIEQFFANLATTMPNFQNLVSGFMTFLGGIIQGTVVLILGVLKVLMAGLEGVLELIGKAINGIKALIEALPGGSAALKGIGDAFGATVKGMQDFTDSWLAVDDSILGAQDGLSDMDGRLLVLQNKLKEGKITVEEYVRALDEFKAKAEQDINTAAIERLNEKIKEYKAELKGLETEQKAAKSIFDQEKEKLDLLKESVRNYFDEQKEMIAQRKESVTEAYDREIEGIKRAGDAMKQRHSVEMSNLKARNAEIQNAIQAEITALQGKTPAEEALAQLRKEEIMDKLRSGDLSEKEKLQLQAQLERMQRQKQIEEKQLQLKAEKENAAKAEAALLKKQKAEQQAIKDAEKEAIAGKKAALKELEEQVDSIEEKEKAVNAMYDKGKDLIDLQAKSFSEILTLVENQVDAVNTAESAYDAATSSVDRMKNALEQATNQANALATAAREAAAARAAATKVPGKYGPGFFAGGPIKGGTVATVNEIGTEGFMSKSGKLSQINAPAFGQWKAPSSGTVIPAHIWAGIKAQKSAGGGSSMTPVGATGTSGISGAIRAMASMQAGSQDVVTNNVTIQSSNPDKTLAQSLVSLRRTKRAKYF